MSFDYRKFENLAAIGGLARLGCSREVLKHAACRYAIASAQPGEQRTGLRQSGISHKQLKAQAKAARDLSGFLERLAQNPRIVAANEMPQQAILRWRRDFDDAAQFLKSLQPFRPDAKEAVLALALYMERRTGERHLPEIHKLLNAALVAAGQPISLTLGYRPSNVGA